MTQSQHTKARSQELLLPPNIHVAERTVEICGQTQKRVENVDSLL